MTYGQHLLKNTKLNNAALQAPHWQVSEELKVFIACLAGLYRLFLDTICSMHSKSGHSALRCQWNSFNALSTFWGANGIFWMPSQLFLKLNQRNKNISPTLQCKVLPTGDVYIQPTFQFPIGVSMKVKHLKNNMV